MDKDELYVALRALLARYEKHFTPSQYNSADSYALDEQVPGYQTLFGYVARGRGGVKLGLYPLKIFSIDWPASLAGARMKAWPWVIKLPSATPAQMKAITATVDKAWKLVAARRKAAPTKPYHRR